MSWFKAINAHDHGASLAHFEPAQRHNIADWDGGDPSMWAHFANVQCHRIKNVRHQVLVQCTFRSTGGDGSSNGDTFWSIAFHRKPGGPWLITGYGQG